MKLTLSRIFETSRLLSEFAKVGIGQSGSDFLEYISSFVEQTIRGLRNGLNFQDNIDCVIKTVSLLNNTVQVVDTSSDRQPTGVIPIRVISTLYDLDAFNWYMDNQGRMVVRAKFTGSPTAKVDVTLVILF